MSSTPELSAPKKLIKERIKKIEEILKDKAKIVPFQSGDKTRQKLWELYGGITLHTEICLFFEEIKNKDLEVKSKYLAKDKYDYFLLKGIVKKEDLDKAISQAKEENKSVETILIERYGVLKSSIGKALSNFYGCPFVYFDPSIGVPTHLIKGFKLSYFKNNRWVPLKKEHNKIFVAIDDPNDMERIEHIKNLLQTPNIKFVVSIKEDIERFIEHFKWQIAVCVDEVIEKKDEVQKWISPKTASITTQVKTIEPVETIETASVVINFVNHMILDAWHRRASDIHLQTCPSKNITQIRFRVDGNCHNYMEIPKDFSKEVISHIKILANLDIAEKRLPQDGKIFFKHKGEPVGEMRIATIPVVGGYEDVAIRLLRKDIPYKLDEIGMTEENLNRFKKVIAQPQGLILCVGPTGCGKTTTLHGVLDFLNRPEVNIWTAEDPIELTFPGLRQIEVSDKIGRSYKRMMRAFLRAGPDIIFVGGIRDKESVNMALEAALTGHLVLSTIHTNSAPETITRLLQMEVDPFNFADSLSAVLSQRLVRMLCRDCKEPYHPNKDEFEVLVRHYGEEYFYKDIGITYSPALTLYRKKRLCRVHEDWLSS